MQNIPFPYKLIVNNQMALLGSKQKLLFKAGIYVSRTYIKYSKKKRAQTQLKKKQIQDTRSKSQPKTVYRGGNLNCLYGSSTC